MAKKRKKYLVTTNSEAFACSLVTSPAMEESFVVFAEDKPLVEKFADEKKHMITGVVAIPNKPIYRRNADGEEYDIVFSSEAIEQMAKNYLKEYRQNEVTLQHQEEAEGVYLVEQWIKTDMVYDKSISVGLSRELPVGSWIQTYYVDSNDVWKRIEEGELQGFSLECMLGLEEFEKQIEQNTNNMNIETNEMFWSKFKNVMKEILSAVSLNKQEEVDVETSEATKITPNGDMECNLEEQAPTVEEPTVVETNPEPQNESKTEEQTTVKEEVKEEPKEAGNESKPNPLEELVKSLTDEVKALKEMNEGLQTKIKDLGKQPSANPVNTNAKPSKADTYSAWRETMRSYLS